jgi:hypothetical protein
MALSDIAAAKDRNPKYLDMIWPLFPNLNPENEDRTKLTVGRSITSVPLNYHSKKDKKYQKWAIFTNNPTITAEWHGVYHQCIPFDTVLTQMTGIHSRPSPCVSRVWIEKFQIPFLVAPRESTKIAALEPKSTSNTCSHPGTKASGAEGR